MDRTPWREASTTLRWPCRVCERGHLRRVADEWPPEEGPANGRRDFLGRLRCDDPECGASASISGTVEPGPAGKDAYRVEQFSPAPCPFIIADNVPHAVRKPLLDASRHLWADHDAAGNKIRRAVEAMMDDRGVAKFPKSGPRKPLSLHSRILRYGKPEVVDKLLALKVIGNAGSHDGGLSRDDILDAFQIMELVLDEVYVGSRRAVEKRAADIRRRGVHAGRARRAGASAST